MLQALLHGQAQQQNLIEAAVLVMLSRNYERQSVQDGRHASVLLASLKLSFAKSLLHFFEGSVAAVRKNRQLKTKSKI